jgi:hypothetical protein
MSPPSIPEDKVDPKSSGFDITQYTGYIVLGVFLILSGGVAYLLMSSAKHDSNRVITSESEGDSLIYSGGNYMYYPYL